MMVMVVVIPAVMVVMVMAMASHFPEIRWTQGALASKAVIFFFGIGITTIMPCFPAVAAGEDVFNALIGWKLCREAGPGGGKGAAVEILDFSGIFWF